MRCALYGADPNWGRIVAALGVCGVDLDTDRDRASTSAASPLVRDGIAVAGRRGGGRRGGAGAPRCDVRIDLARRRRRRRSSTAPTSSTEYVLNNSEYTT